MNTPTTTISTAAVVYEPLVIPNAWREAKEIRVHSDEDGQLAVTLTASCKLMAAVPLTSDTIEQAEAVLIDSKAHVDKLKKDGETARKPFFDMSKTMKEVTDSYLSPLDVARGPLRVKVGQFREAERVAHQQKVAAEAKRLADLAAAEAKRKADEIEAKRVADEAAAAKAANEAAELAALLGEDAPPAPAPVKRSERCPDCGAEVPDLFDHLGNCQGAATDTTKPPAIDTAKQAARNVGPAPVSAAVNVRKVWKLTVVDASKVPDRVGSEITAKRVLDEAAIERAWRAGAPVPGTTWEQVEEYASKRGT